MQQLCGGTYHPYLSLFFTAEAQYPFSLFTTTKKIITIPITIKNNKGSNVYRVSCACNAAECSKGDGREFATICELRSVVPCADVDSLDIIPRSGGEPTVHVLSHISSSEKAMRGRRRENKMAEAEAEEV